MEIKGFESFKVVFDEPCQVMPNAVKISSNGAMAAENVKFMKDKFP